MRTVAFVLFSSALVARVAAQDASATATDNGSGDATDLSPATETLAPSTTVSMPPTLESGVWNITYFVAPTRNNYWVNDNTNTAAWQPINVATNLILTNSNSSVYTGSIVLAQNLAAGTSSYQAAISGVNPGNNYILWLTVAGDPSQKLAQTQGFHIKPNSTAAMQQIQSQSAIAAAAAGNTGAGAGAAAASGASDGSGGTVSGGGSVTSGTAKSAAGRGAVVAGGVGGMLLAVAAAAGAMAL